MTYENILYSVENHIALITLNRPQVLNALNYWHYLDIDTAIEAADKDSNVRVIVITGAGRAFCAGEDLKQQAKGKDSGYPGADNPERMDRERTYTNLQLKPTYRGEGREYVLPGTRLRQINKPSIAAVNGVCAGYGNDLALSCSMRIASEKARFGEVFINLGVIPEEGMQIIPRLTSLCKAYEIILTGDFVEAKDAYEMGLVNKVVPPEQLMPVTMELAAKIASKAPLAIQLACEGIRRGFYETQQEARQWTNLAFHFLTKSGDWSEAAKAFAEKRPPQFKGE